MAIIWTNCNRCHIRHVDQRFFVLTTCAHVLCTNCAHDLVEHGKCPACSQEAAYIPYTKKLKPQLISYFYPLEKTLKVVVRIKKLIDQQEKKRANMINYLVNKSNKTRNDYLRLIQLYKQCKHNLAYRAKIRNAVRMPFVPTPAPQPEPAPAGAGPSGAGSRAAGSAETRPVADRNRIVIGVIGQAEETATAEKSFPNGKDQDAE